MSLSSQLKIPQPWLVGLVIAALATTGGIAAYTFSQVNASSPVPVEAAPPRPVRVTALGRLEPEGEVVRIAAPLNLNGDRVAQLQVQDGDRVQAGQIIAVLDSRDRLQDELRQAEEQVRVAEARLAQVRAGAKAGEIAAQQAEITRLQAALTGEQATQAATIARWQAEVQNARAEYERFQALYTEGAESRSVLDSKRLALQTAEAQLREATAAQTQTLGTYEAQLQEANARLNQIAEVRPVDVQTAQTEVTAALAAVQRAQTALEQAYIRAPMAGRILKIHTQPGEQISESGIADLGQTDRMLAIAEVYQTDISQVKLGQEAVITSPSFDGELQGTVSQVGLQVSRQNVFSNEPGENLDRRVVEVKIQLTPEASQQVATLTNLQVQVAIQR